MMSKLEILLRSGSTWAIAGVFVFHGLTAILPDLHGNVANLAQIILIIIGFFQKTKEIQVAGAKGTLGGITISRY